MQTAEPDLQAWCADAMDLISRLKTYSDLPCQDYIVCGNKIELPMEMAIITCALFGNLPMTYLPTKGCNNRLSKDSVNRCTANFQGFYIDECYMHFKPMIADGAIINVNGLGRPLDDNGYPLVPEVAILAISEYICARLCMRHRDNRYGEFQRLWEKHCLRARAELNQFSNKQIEELGYRYLAVPYPANYSNGAWGFAYGNGNLQ